MMQPVYISTTYLGPVQQYCKLYHCRRQRSVSFIYPHREAGHVEVSDQGHPYLRSWELASPALERFGFGL